MEAGSPVQMLPQRLELLVLLIVTLIFLVIFCGLGFGGLLLSFEMIEGM